jgi:O-antigen/teichoic acid export membrane protein
VFFIGALFLSPADFGLVGLASSLVVSVIAFSPVAFGEALVQRKVLSKSHADTVFILTTSFGLICFTAFVLLTDQIAGAVGQTEIAVILPILALKIPLDMAAAVPNSLIIRSMKFKLIALRTAVASMVSVVICLTMLFAGYGYWALVASQVSASVVACAMAYWVAGWRPGITASWPALKELLNYGIFASGNRMLSTIKLDHLVLGILGGTATLGLFIFAQRFYNMLTQLVGGALSSVTLALLSTLQDDKDKTAQAFDIASFVSVAASLPMFCALAITVPDLLELMLNDKWAGAAFPIQMFCITGVLAAVGVVQASLIKSQGKAKWWFYYQLGQQSTSVLVIGLTYSFGLPVMMVALVVKSMLVWPVSVVMTAKLLERSPWSYITGFANPIAATLAMGIGMLAIPHFVPDLSQLVTLYLQLGLGVVIYVPTIVLLSRDRVTQLLHFLPKKRTPTT